ncbi:MAG: glycosyltransferase family 2 protein, partial [Acetobacteraceae bacterium]
MPKIVGFIDGLEGSYVRGWASADGGPAASVTIRDRAGKLLARGQTGLHRPDVERLGEGAMCGFRIPVRRFGSAGALHVFGDGIELAGSPVRVGAGLYDGAITVADGIVSGWVMERTELFRGAVVRLHDQDGLLLGEVEAGVEEGAADPLHAPARFSIPLEQTCFGRHDLIVRASADGVRFAQLHCAMRLDGYLDALTSRRCSGWLLSPDAPARALRIEVFRDDVQVGSGTCDYPREDVRNRYPQATRVGFEITLAAPADESGPPHVYSVRLAGTRTELFDGPLVVEERADAIESARRVGRRAQADPTLSAQDRAVLRRALAAFVGQRRHGAERTRVRVAPRQPDLSGGRRLSIIIPCYRGLDLTRACIESVLAVRDPVRDVLTLINDCSPDPGMAELLEGFALEPGVFLLTNAENQGFVRAANRGMAACRHGDVLLLNSDTRVFPGVFEELCHIAHLSPDIGTVTPLSNNATLFSYPHISLPNVSLADMDWADIAALAREANGGVAIDVPTGHGFCMLIRRDALDLGGAFDEAFGRGYGEENDFCQRLADLGFRNVAAVGAFVEHRDSVSFGSEKKALVEANLARLARMYPEYAAAIAVYEREDGLRRARWPLDAARLRKAGANGTNFTLVVTNWLGGGARKALLDIESTAGYGGTDKLTLSCRADGRIELTATAPALHAVFAADETEALFDLLSATRIARVLVHQVLGFPPGFMDGLAGFVAGRQAVFYAHDFYTVCPRVTMIDATGQFCDIAPPETCQRCVAAGGAHEASRLD